MSHPISQALRTTPGDRRASPGYAGASVEDAEPKSKVAKSGTVWRGLVASPDLVSDKKLDTIRSKSLKDGHFPEKEGGWCGINSSSHNMRVLKCITISAILLFCGILPAESATPFRTKAAKKKFKVSPIQMKLEKVGDTVISTDGKYSEDTAVRVTAINGTSGGTLTKFNKSVNIAESGTSIYSQNGGALPSNVTVVNGIGTFLARSLAGPKVSGALGVKPDPAIIITTNYPPKAPLPVEQWVDLGKKHSKSNGPVFDWLEARAKDIFDGATGDLATVLSKITTYEVARFNSGARMGPNFFVTHLASQPMFINPFFVQARLDSPANAVCGHARTKFFTNSVIHESRHSYQSFLTTLDLSAPEDLPGGAAEPNNDDDQDYLVNTVPIAPTTVLIDSTATRTVCNVDLSPSANQPIPYKGDAAVDSVDSPDHVRYALEKDAYIFGDAHD